MAFRARKAKVGLAIAALFFSTSTAFAIDPNGWCLPADACMGEMKPIAAYEYSECESTCRLYEPVEIRGMNATLFDRVCEGDWGNRRERVMFTLVGEESNDQHMLLITNVGIEELRKCI